MRGEISLKEIIRDVQADFFNTLYAKSGLVHFLTSEINNFSEDEQKKLKELFERQNKQAVALVESLKKVGAYAEDLAKIDSKIKKIIGDKGLEFETSKGVETALVGEENIDTNNAVVEAPTIEAPPSNAVETPTVEAAPATAVEIPTVEAAPANVVETPTVEDAPANVGKTPTFEATPANIVETPTVEAASENTVVEEGPFTLSPIDDGVTPIEQSSSTVAEIPVTAPQVPIIPVVETPAEASIAPVAEQQTPVPQPQVAVVDAGSDTIKLTKSDINPPKAILVTPVQLEKLVNSREVQKALVSANGTKGSAIAPIAPVANVQVDEQTLMVNGLLTPTEEATKKQMEGIMEQASTLYKEGKTTEAQALYNQVSTMNQSMQAANTVQPDAAKVLVNTPASAPVVAS